MQNAAALAASKQPAPRVSRRMKIFLPVTLVRGDMTARAHLLDMSKTGALAHIGVAPSSKEQVEILWEDLSWSGHVVWTWGNRFGIAFDTPLCDAQLEAMLNAR